MITIAVAAAIGAAIGAIGMGAASAATGNIPGLNIALQHIPQGTHGFSVVNAVTSAAIGGGAGGGIGASVAAVAKALIPAAKA